MSGSGRPARGRGAPENGRRAPVDGHGDPERGPGGTPPAARTHPERGRGGPGAEGSRSERRRGRPAGRRGGEESRRAPAGGGDPGREGRTREAVTPIPADGAFGSGRPAAQSPPDTPEGGRARRRRSSFEVEALSERGLGRRQQKILIAVVTVVVVLAGGFGLTLVVSTLGVRTPPPEQGSAADAIGLARPADYQGWNSPKPFGPIADRRADASPLRAEEVFAARTLTGGKLRLRLLDRRLDGACAPVMWGGGALAALARTGCTQAVRGIYLSADRRYVAQYTLFNMSGAAAAEAFVKEMAILYRGGGWIRPLESGGAAFSPDGYSEASGQAMGHYAGFVWVARADGKEPAGKDDFVSLALAARGGEKAIYRRVVAVTGPGTPPGK
ncbi:hypothetical protein Sru01_18940 [Sphaerisporangium rufum]|uniref:Uncharacterized protein n=1 Tax=Sphaerisporangium rufum TaxID=1381558 RepID=A0A919R4I9_9ACTN|nr:hypothetical protein [Sphaerisporangium rufum]GII76912.1 hypothetical protein Sru01_18940 [Sphaerisporangium rufum]